MKKKIKVKKGEKGFEKSKIGRKESRNTKG